MNISTPAFICDEDIESSVALTVLPDNDKDGIADEDDLDDAALASFDAEEGDDGDEGGLDAEADAVPVEDVLPFSLRAITSC